MFYAQQVLDLVIFGKDHSMKSNNHGKILKLILPFFKKLLCTRQAVLSAFCAIHAAQVWCCALRGWERGRCAQALCPRGRLRAFPDPPAWWQACHLHFSLFANTVSCTCVTWRVPEGGSLKEMRCMEYVQIQRLKTLINMDLEKNK